jgi:branched-chain amino acid transport system substrate-binding protein
VSPASCRGRGRLLTGEVGMRAWRVTRWLAVIAVIGGIGAVERVSAETPIRIGAVLSTTGKYAPLGEWIRQGYLLCGKDLNAQGGLLGRKVELTVYDDTSESDVTVRMYEKLIVVDKMDALLGPVTSLSTDASANVTESAEKVMVAPLATSAAIWQRGRKYLFMVRSSAEVYLESFLDLAVKNDIKTVAFLNEEHSFTTSAIKGAVELAKKKGMKVVFREEYPKDTSDFRQILTKIKAEKPDALALSTFLPDVQAITAQMKEVDLNVKMMGTTVGTDRMLAKEGEDVLGASQWEPSLPYPGNKEFVEAYKKEQNQEPGDVAAGAYASCQVLAEAVRRAKTLNSDKLRDQLVKLRMKTVFGDYAVDERGFQTGHKLVVTQWQRGRWWVVWPEDAATAKFRFPLIPWDQR